MAVKKVQHCGTIAGPDVVERKMRREGTVQVVPTD